MKRKHKAFTLVELLVVIGIIGVLVALLLPSLAKSRRAAKQQLCASNLHQIAVAAYMYSTDSQSYIVPSGQIYDSPSSSRNWAYEQLTSTSGVNTYVFKNGFLGRYLQTPKVLLCPEMVDVPLFVPSNFNCDTNSTYALVQLSPWPPYVLTAVPTQSPLRVNRIRQTRKTACVADAIFLTRDSAIGPGRYMEYTNGQAIWAPSSSASSLPLFHGRHANGLGNVAFWDGHVQAIPALVPPVSVAASTPPDAYATVQSLKIGFLAPSPVDWSQAGTMGSTTWTQFGRSGFDYYFWIGQK